MKRGAVALIGLLTLVLAVTACGGGGSSSSSSSPDEGGGEVSKAAYIEEADAICEEGQEKIAPLKAELEELEESPEPESEENLTALAEVLKSAGVEAEGEFEKLRELEEPAEDEEELDTLYTMSEESQEIGVEGAELLEDGELEEFSELATEASHLDSRSKQMAQAYGFKVCGQEEE